MYYRTEETKAKLPEYRLINKHKGLEPLLTSLGYIKNKDYKLIYHRGYATKEVIRFIKAKMKNNEDAIVEQIKDFLLTKEIYKNSTESEKFYYNLPKELK